MTELPRYIGRHASPEAAAPPSDETTPEEDSSVGDPSMPRLDFDPGGPDEETTVLEHPDVIDRTSPGRSMPPRPDRWSGPPRDETPPPGPEPPTPDSFAPPGAPATARLPGSPGRPIRPDSWTMRPDRSSTPLADSVASTPPQPPAIQPSPIQPVPPPSAPSAPEPPRPPQAEADEPPDAEPWWTAPAPDVPAGPVPAPEPAVEAAAAPEPVPEPPDDGEPDPDVAPETDDDVAVADDPAPEPDDEESDTNDEPTVETATDDAEAAAGVEAAPALDLAPVIEPTPEPDPELDDATDPELDDAIDPEPDPEPEAELDVAPDLPSEPTTPAEPSTSSAPFNAWRDEPMLTPAPGPIRRSPVRREIDSHGLARLALLDAVGETWPGGTPDLSAWLAANLDLLEDPLGFSLEPRHPVPLSPERQLTGGYDTEQTPLDLPGNVVTADGSGATVMVRAQVGEADPEGLGALLAAAATSQAQTAVWVCPRIDDGFRQALRWVGGDPSANVRLYGLEMYLVRINDSSTAPLFDAVVAPGAP